MKSKGKNGLMINEGDYLLVKSNNIRLAVIYRGKEKNYLSILEKEY